MIGPSLRARLLAGLVALTACGLAAGAAFTYVEQRSFLMHRVDQQVRSALAPAAFALGQAGHRAFGVPPARRRADRPAGRPPPGPGAALPPGTFAALVSAGGTVIETQTFSYGQRSRPRPALPAQPPLSRIGALHPFTIGGSVAGRYRAAAYRTRGGRTLLVAVPLHEVEATLHRLVMIELLAVAGVILAMVALGFVVIGLGLQPLRRIERTASEIAAGDLSRRVSPADGRTEIGRLGRSLNEMLGQIESAFADRRDSEDRLRRFLADASHELRTPLSAIRGYAELFRIGAADDPQTLARAMSRIESEATRMGVLVEDLLLLAQLDQVREPRREPIDVAELVRQAAEDLRVTAPDRDVTVRVDEADGAVFVLGDRSQLSQVLANLTRNAAVHTPAGTDVELTVTTGGGHVSFAVRDHGPGLPADGRERLFERLWRAERGRSRGRAGAGLGLAIADAVVRAHAGSIEAADAAGGGAVFVVSLPGATVPWPGAAAAGGPAPPVAEGPVPAPARAVALTAGGDGSQQSLSGLTDDS